MSGYSTPPISSCIVGTGIIAVLEDMLRGPPTVFVFHTVGAGMLPLISEATQVESVPPSGFCRKALWTTWRFAQSVRVSMDAQDPRLRQIWEQQSVPVIFRQQQPSRVLIRLPFAAEVGAGHRRARAFSADNAKWLRGEHRHIPKWIPQFKCWKTPVSWFNDLIEQCLRRFGRVYVVQLHREQQKCAPACWNAVGFDCECSCMGAGHGAGHPGGRWYEVSDTFAYEWGPRKYACRLLVAKPSPTAGQLIS